MADELERLFRILVRRVRDLRPENLSRPFEVAEILRTFVPYRAHRADVGVETAEDYEVLVLRLLSGRSARHPRCLSCSRFPRSVRPPATGSRSGC